MSHCVKNYFPGPWGTGISDAICSCLKPKHHVPVFKIYLPSDLTEGIFSTFEGNQDLWRQIGGPLHGNTDLL